MPVRRRTAALVVGVPVLVLLLLLLVPAAFSGRIAAAVRGGLERSLDAHVDWTGASVGLIRGFPNLTLRLDSLSVRGTGVFEADTLLTVNRLSTVLDVRSVVRNLRDAGPVVVRTVDVDAPEVRLLRLADGRSNWDIVRPSETSREPARRGAEVQLRRVVIRDGVVRLADRQAGLVAAIVGLEHTLSGDFRQQQFTLESETAADSVSVQFAGVPYLHRARLRVDAKVGADMTARRFTLQDNSISLNELVLRSAGTLDLGNSPAVDVSFTAPSTDFADILSLVPAIYTNDFQAIQTAGRMTVAGRVAGGIGEGEFPGFDITARVEDGSFRYPDLPLPARDIAFDLTMANPGGSADSTVVRLDGVRIRLGDDLMQGALTLRTPVSDPDVAVQLQGRLDLANVQRTMKLDDVERLAGVIVADASMRARQSDVDARRHERIEADGTVELAGVVVAMQQPARTVHIDEALLRFTPSHVELVALRARSGNTAVNVTGSLDNILGYALLGGDLRGEARITGPWVDLNEWRSDDEMQAVPVPAGIDLAAQAELDRVTFGTLDMRNATGALRVAGARATLEAFRVDVLDGGMMLSGFYETTDPQRPAFDMQVSLQDINVPDAFANLATVRAFAPIAEYARGRASADLRLTAPLEQDMTPVLEVLTGTGSLTTSNLVIEGFPLLDRLAERLDVNQLRNPGFTDMQAAFDIRNGRMFVRPFDVTTGPLTLGVSGSNGMDRSLDYRLVLRLPASAAGPGVGRALPGLAALAGRAGMEAADVEIGVLVGGSVQDPSLSLELREVAGSVARGAEQALRDRAAERVESATERADQAAADARQRAREEAARLVEAAEVRAEQIRAEARELAERVRQEGRERGDSLVVRANNPAARLAAQAAADRVRRAADEQADRMVAEADQRAADVVAEARRRAAEVEAGGAPAGET
jgi:hypothetical protein